jgi:arylsulfatase A-like enzyme
LTGGSPAKAKMNKKKNLIIITPDQMRSDFLSCYGHKFSGTDNISRLAAEGVKFNNCYCASPLCGPSRISFAISAYVGEHNCRNYASTISPDVPNLISALKNNGYKTGMFGKNHLFTYNRLNEVWDCLDEICLGNYDGHSSYVHSYSSFELDENHPYNITKRLTNETIEFMRNAAAPFAAWVNYQDPHPAFICPPPYSTMFSPYDITLPENYDDYNKSVKPARNHTWRVHSGMTEASDTDVKKAIAMYLGQIRYVDDSVGNILEFLKESSLEKDTVVLFFSDHGELAGDHGMVHKNPSFYDCLTKIPCIIKGAGLPEGWEFNGLTEEIDLAPTLLDALDVEIPYTMAGKSWYGDIMNYCDSGRESVLCEAGIGAPTCRTPIDNLKLKAPHEPTGYGPGAMLRCGKWKLSVYCDDEGELYNIEEDPREITNLYYNGDYNELRSKLENMLLKRILAVKVRNIPAEKLERLKYHEDVRSNPLMWDSSLR